MLDFGLARKFANKVSETGPFLGVLFRRAKWCPPGSSDGGGRCDTLRFNRISEWTIREGTISNRGSIRWSSARVDLCPGASIKASISWSPHTLPFSDSIDVVTAKRDSRKFPDAQFALLGECPPVFEEMLKYIDSLDFFETPNYQNIFALLGRIKEDLGEAEEDWMLDWEVRLSLRQRLGLMASKDF
jgi:hypothetical protein